jgi:hypothetical protein
MSGWRAVAHKGEFALTVLTPARVREKNLTPPATDATLLAFLHSDGEPTAAVWFTSLQALNAFVQEMEPRFVDIACSPSDDASVVAVLREISGQTTPLTIN